MPRCLLYVAFDPLFRWPILPELLHRVLTALDV
jgi:hypothetical protein